MNECVGSEIGTSSGPLAVGSVAAGALCAEELGAGTLILHPRVWIDDVCAAVLCEYGQSDGSQNRGADGSMVSPQQFRQPM